MADALIETPPPGAVRSASSTLAKVALLLGASLLVGTGIVDNVFPNSGPRPIGREARELARARKQRRLQDGTAAKWIEKEMRFRSRVRAAVAPPWAALLLRYGRTAPRELVIGEGGWLFLRARAEVNRETRDHSLARTQAVCAAMDRRLASLGTEVLIAPIPRKSVVCAELLPKGIDPDRSFDEEVVRVLREAGLPTIDLLAPARDLAVPERYLRLDSHWAPGLQRALADEVAAMRPGLLDKESALHLSTTPAPALRGLLSFAAVDVRGTYANWVGREISDMWRLEPTEARLRVQSGDKAAVVAMVGSSFTSGLRQADVLAGRLGRSVWSGGLSATPFLGSLAKYMRDFADRELPATTVYEFPVHQLFPLGRNMHSAGTSIGDFFACASRGPTTPLPIVPNNIPGGRELAVFRPGSVLTSGDGAAQVVLRYTSDKKTQWVLHADGLTLHVHRPPGTHRLVLPVIETARRGGRIAVRGMNPAALASKPDVTVEIDGDLEASKALAIRGSGAEWTAEGLDGPLPPHRLAVCTWSGGRPRRLAARIEGTRADGSPFARDYTFEQPSSSTLVLNLDPWAGGAIGAIRLSFGKAVLNDVTVQVAPLLRR